MTEKQEKILSTALRLFSENGYDATSTSKVAKAAGVSEGLIFRHFENKEGLLQAVIDMGNTHAQQLYERAFRGTSPEAKLRGIIEMPFQIGEEQYHFWKLLYALKWQTDQYDSSISDPVREVLMQVFEELGYENPLAETEIVLLLIDGLATAILLRRPAQIEAIKTALLAKYNL
jgi:AcrR family transcriptional regulator